MATEAPFKQKNISDHLWFCYDCDPLWVDAIYWQLTVGEELFPHHPDLTCRNVSHVWVQTTGRQPELFKVDLFHFKTLLWCFYIFYMLLKKQSLGGCLLLHFYLLIINVYRTIYTRRNKSQRSHLTPVKKRIPCEHRSVSLPAGLR